MTTFNPPGPSTHLLPLFNDLPVRPNHQITLDLVIDNQAHTAFLVDEVAVTARQLVQQLCDERHWFLHAVATAPTFLHVRVTVPVLLGGEKLGEELKSFLRNQLRWRFPHIAQLHALWRWDVLVTAHGPLTFAEIEEHLMRVGRRAPARRGASK